MEIKYTTKYITDDTTACIIGYPKYIIYGDGRIYSKYSNKFLRINKTGWYSVVTVYNDVGNFKCHKAVVIAIAFLGHVINGYALVIDHIDGDRSNDHIHNLQRVTQRVNSSKDKANKTGFTGVFKRGKRFRGKFAIGSTSVYLGTFNNDYDAATAYLLVQAFYNEFIAPNYNNGVARIKALKTFIKGDIKQLNLI